MSLISSETFQFHTGLIKIQSTLCTDQKLPSFQFHTGLIKILKYRPLYDSSGSAFQFHTGLIKIVNQTGQLAQLVDVSIPHWSD